MNETPTAMLDQAAFQRVWRRVMPQDRPDCPFSLEPSDELTPTPAPQPLVRSPLPAVSLQAAPQSVPCLSEASTGELPTLEERMEETFRAQREYRALERRTGQRGGLSALSGEKARQLRRLNAAYFLISGRDYSPHSEPATLPQNSALALRERFRAEQMAAAALLDAAQSSADPCLARLYRELAEEDRIIADRVRGRLERR